MAAFNLKGKYNLQFCCTWASSVVAAFNLEGKYNNSVDRTPESGSYGCVSLSSVPGMENPRNSNMRVLKKSLRFKKIFL